MKNRFNGLLYILKIAYEKDRKYIYLQILYNALLIIINYIYMLFPSAMVSLVLDSKQVDSKLLIMTTVMIFILFVNLVISFLRKELSIKIEVLNYHFKKMLTAASMSVTFEKIEDSEYQSLKNDALYPLDSRGSIYTFFDSITKLLQSLIMMIGIIGIIILFDYIYLLLVLALTILNIIINQFYIKKEKESVKDDIRISREYVYYLELITNPSIAKDVRIFKQQNFFHEKIKKLFNYYILNGEKQYGSQDARAGFNKLISIIIMIFSYSYLLYLTMSEDLSIATFLLLFNASLIFSSQIYIIFDNYLVSIRELEYLKAFQRFMQKSKSYNHSGDIIFDGTIESIEFRDVSFKYPNTDKYVLKKISFLIEDKDKLAIVGENGCGKSTIIKLISRLYAPSSGNIYINGKDIKTLEYSSYIKSLAIIFQDFKTFSFSIKENIVLDNVLNNVLLDDSIEKSDLELDIINLKLGIETNISKEFDENGVFLSKGQEQKLVIARAIYSNGSLMILDEPTASLDPIAEQQVYNHFQTITNNKLSIFISHRLSSCKFANKIFYLEDGNLLESGTHDDLIKKKGKYKKMYDIQASQYKS